MRQKEQRLWDRMRSAARAEKLMVQRVENMAVPGMPDVIGCALGNVTWCELKAVDSAPRRPGTPVLSDEGLRPEQVNWHIDWRRAGGSSLIIIGIGRGPSTVDVALFGRWAPTVNRMTLSQILAAGIIGWRHIIPIIKVKK